LPFCLATGPIGKAASITHATARQMMVRGLIERATGATSYKLTDQAARCSPATENPALAADFVRLKFGLT
jgi:hypothetical protein